MAEPITQAMYSVPITRRVGYYESQIPEEYRGRTHTAKQEHVRCALFPGENMVKVTWGGADEATVIYQREEQGKAVATQTLGVIPAGGCSLEAVQCPRAHSPGLRVRQIRYSRTRGRHRSWLRHGHRHGRILARAGWSHDLPTFRCCDLGDPAALHGRLFIRPDYRNKRGEVESKQSPNTPHRHQFGAGLVVWCVPRPDPGKCGRAHPKSGYSRSRVRCGTHKNPACPRHNRGLCECDHLQQPAGRGGHNHGRHHRLPHNLATVGVVA